IRDYKVTGVQTCALPISRLSTVLVEIIRRAAARKVPVLACAPSNLAVDNLVERLVAAGVRPVRVGHPARVLESVLEHTLEARVRSEERRVGKGGRGGGGR